MRADMHCHTTASDGSLSPEELVDYAARIGLGCVAVTDHDTMAAVPAARARAARKGIRLLEGMEVSAMNPATGRKVHLLLYAPEHPEPLLELCARTLHARDEAAKAIVERIKGRYPVDWETVRHFAGPSEAVYKQHILLALGHMGYAQSVFGPLFRELFAAPDGWARVPVSYPDVRQALELMRQSGGFCVLAHPGVYDSFGLIGELSELGLEGIEVCHPRHSESDERAAREAARRYGLVMTGGSDFHGFFSAQAHPLAVRTAPEESLPAVFRRCGMLPEPTEDEK